MVKKPEEECGMCINLTDLNKHYPKDCYSLPSIDQKVETIPMYEVLFFFDLYKEYHQVLMDPANMAKTAFVTNWSIFAYKKMMFHLKNIGATY